MNYQTIQDRMPEALEWLEKHCSSQDVKHTLLASVILLQHTWTSLDELSQLANSFKNHEVSI